MKYFYGIILALVILNGCSTQGDQKGQTKYSFSDQNNQTFTIKSNFENLDIYTQKSEEITKIAFIMFLDLESQDAKNYIANINHLKLTFSGVSIFGILTKPYTQDQIDAYIKQNNVHFPLLNPTDSKDIFKDFENKINPPQQPGASSTQPQTQQEKQSIELPFFVLYDKNGAKYQIYSGVVAEEMFAYDISTLLKH